MDGSLKTDCRSDKSDLIYPRSKTKRFKIFAENFQNLNHSEKTSEKTSNRISLLIIFQNEGLEMAKKSLFRSKIFNST